jgi:hypothetical protein
MSVICALILFIVPSLLINGVYLFLRTIVQQNGTLFLNGLIFQELTGAVLPTDTVFGLAYSDMQSKQQPLHHMSESDTGISNNATLIKRLDGSRQEGSIIFIADIVALVFFVVVIAVAGWVLFRRRRNQEQSDAQQGRSEAQESDIEAPQPQNATNQDGKGDDADVGPHTAYPRSTNSSFVRIPTPGSSTFRSLRISMIPTPTHRHRPVTISNPISVKSTMEWHELDPYPYPSFGPEGLQRHNSSKAQQRNRQSEPAQTMLSRNLSGATTLSSDNSLRKLAGILEGNMRFSGASYPEEAALSETTHGILSRQTSSSSRFSISTVVSPKDDLYRVSSDAPAVPPIPAL